MYLKTVKLVNNNMNLKYLYHFIIKKVFFLFILMNTHLDAFTQFDPAFSQYMFNHSLFNPAATGSEDIISASAIYQQKWIITEGAPRTAAFDVQAPLRNENIALGISVFNKSIGIEQMFKTNINYAHKIKIANGKLAMGLRLSITNQSFDWNRVEAIQDDDILLYNARYNTLLPNVAFGMYYRNKYFYSGISASNLVNVQSKQDLFSPQGSSIYQTSQYYMMAGYNKDISEKISVNPSVFYVYIKNVSSYFELNTNIIYNQFLIIGASYRTNNTIVLINGYQVSKRIQLSLAYDLSLSKYISYTGGSFEVMLHYKLRYDNMNFLNPRLIHQN